MSRPTAQPGHLYGVGVGPGDPDLITLRAAGLIATADVVAYHRAPHRASTARTIAAAHLREGVVEEALVYPVTTGAAEHPLGYYGALADFYDECAERFRVHLRAGRSVVCLAEGDPFFFGSFMYVHDALRDEFPTEVVPGVTAMAAASAAVGAGLARHEDTVTVLPGTLPVAELARRLADTDAAVVMKLGRTFPAVREALRQAGLLERALYVEHASRPAQRVLPVTEVDETSVPYMSIIVVPGVDRRADVAGRAAAVDTAGVDGAAVDADPVDDDTVDDDSANGGTTTASVPVGTVYVVGLGPGPQEWTSPEASDVLGRVAHVVGYAPYVARVAQREGLTRHASGNTVEVDRGRLALDLALGGEDVAVVSGGDAGVFGMASAVIEAAEGDDRYAEVPVHVIPGITAAHAAAARAGALLGGDHALLSLSDRLKPWEVIVDRLTSAVRADLAVAIYNPRSRSRPDQLARALGGVRAVAPPERVVVVARQVGRAGEDLHVTTLGALDPETVDMSCLVVIGSSTTRVTRAGRVWTPRWTGSRTDPVDRGE